MKCAICGRKILPDESQRVVILDGSGMVLACSSSYDCKSIPQPEILYFAEPERKPRVRQKVHKRELPRYAEHAARFVGR